MSNPLLTRHPPAPPPAIEPILVGSAEAARLLGVSERTLTDASWSDVPRIRRGGRVLFSVAALRAWAAAEVARQASQVAPAGEAAGG